MRIPSADITAQTRQIPLVSRPVSQPPAGQPQVQAAADSYNKNSRQSTPQVIDAEYVEVYPAAAEALNQERRTRIDSLAAETAPGPQRLKSGSPLAAVAEKYQQSEKSAARPPGALLNIYA